MSAAYVLLVGTEPDGDDRNQTTVGPFGSAAEAVAWADRPEVGNWFRGQAAAWGGYPAVRVIAADRCDHTPEEWIEDHDDEEVDAEV